MKDEEKSVNVSIPTQAGKLLLVLLFVAAPHAVAHGGYDAGAPLAEGSVHVRIVGAPLVAAQAPLRLEASTDLAPPVHARLVDPDADAGLWFPLRAEGRLLVADVVFESAGEWRLDVRAGGEVASFDVSVWPAGPTFVEPAGEAATRGVLVAGGGEPLTFRLLDAAHRALAPPADAYAIISGPDGEEQAPLIANGDVLELRREWPTPGSFTIEIVSDQAQLAEGARPAVGVLVAEPGDEDVYDMGSKDVPFGLLAIPAILLALLFLRRPG